MPKTQQTNMDHQALEDTLVEALTARKVMLEEKHEWLTAWRTEFQRLEGDIERYRRILSGDEKQLTLPETE